MYLETSILHQKFTTCKHMKNIFQNSTIHCHKFTPCVMNHIPLHPFAIKSHPNLIPSLPNLPPMFLPFRHFQTLCHSSLVALSPVTHHIITPSFRRHYSSLSVSVITVLRYFGSLLPLLSSEHHSRLCGWMITI